MDGNRSLGPFNVYDIFAYLGNGFTLLVILYILSDKYHVSSSWSQVMASSALSNAVIRIALIAVVSYAVGHVLAHLSYPIYERLLVGRFFGTPGDQAMGKVAQSSSAPTKSRIRTWVLYLLGVPDYARTLSPEIISQIESPTPLIGTSGGTASSEHYSLRSCFVIVNEYMPMTRSRVATFLEIYSYCRNGSLTFLILFIATLVTAQVHGVFLALGFFLISWIMLGRYLRFLKLYTDEIYLGYATYKTTSVQVMASSNISSSVSKPNAVLPSRVPPQ